MVFAKLLETRSHLIPGRLKVSELLFEVPVDYSNKELGSTQLFARSVTRYEKPIAVASDEEDRKKSQKPWFVYLQGGPGFGCSPPQHSSITNMVLDKGYQMLYLDQRGTGLSSPISAQSLALRDDILGQIDFLKQFRADNIVRDCEAIREILTHDYPAELKKWSVFGQSFGGFCVFTYLSNYPSGLREAFTAGGIPPIGQSPDEVYKATYRKVIERNREYYKKYPEDKDAVHNLALHIANKGGLKLPSGTILTVRLFLTLGRNFGFHGGLDMVHDLILRMRIDLTQFNFISRPTLTALESVLSLDDAVLYVILHEAIYCENQASNWAAERVGKSLKEFKWIHGNPQSEDSVRAAPLYFSGEMMYPFLFEVCPELQKLSKVAEGIAKYAKWPDLYDQFQLSQNQVPLYAATFVNDMFVDYGLAQRTAKLVRNCKQHITNNMYHDAIRSRTGDLMKQLFELREDNID